MSKRRDSRSTKAQAWRGWYSLAAWKARRLDQLTREPLCRMCLEDGHTTAATVADHIIEHKGDPDLFWHGELQSLCKTHHDATKQQIEKGGYSSAADLDGYPTDPNHPANKAERPR